jgi:hypothetical protein
MAVEGGGTWEECGHWVCASMAANDSGAVGFNSCSCVCLCALTANTTTRQVWDEYTESFEDEFDYRREAALLRRCCNCIPHARRSKVSIPLPIDAEHPVYQRVKHVRWSGVDTIYYTCTVSAFTMDIHAGPVVALNSAPAVSCQSQCSAARGR